MMRVSPVPPTPALDPAALFHAFAAKFKEQQQLAEAEADAAHKRKTDELNERIRNVEMSRQVAASLDHGLQIVGHIGRGGFGQVFLCQRDENGIRMPYAVKEVMITEGDDWLLREVKTLLPLRHKNVVRCRGYWTKQYLNVSHLYIWMDYCGLNNFKHALNSDPLFRHPKNAALNTIAQILKECLEGLAFIHEWGILHRDISPENIILDECYTPTFVDFGSSVDARMLSNSLTMGHGKALYMAPEMYSSSYTRKTDVYSLGIVFYEAILDLGRPATDREYNDEVAQEIESFKKTSDFFANPWIENAQPELMQNIQALIREMVSYQDIRPDAKELLESHKLVA